MKTYSPIPLAPSDLVGIKQALAEDGVAVVTGILSEQEQEQFLDFFWTAVSARVPALQREDPSSWVEENTDWYGTFGAGQYKVTSNQHLLIHSLTHSLCHSVVTPIIRSITVWLKRNTAGLFGAMQTLGAYSKKEWSAHSKMVCPPRLLSLAVCHWMDVPPSSAQQ